VKPINTWTCGFEDLERQPSGTIACKFCKQVMPESFIEQVKATLPPKQFKAFAERVGA
jgi:hypothetical protein